MNIENIKNKTVCMVDLKSVIHTVFNIKYIIYPDIPVQHRQIP